jgi:hypothetical protein
MGTFYDSTIAGRPPHVGCVCVCVHPPYVAQSAIVVECERLPFQASVVVRLGLARRRVSEREEQDKQEHSNE